MSEEQPREVGGARPEEPLSSEPCLHAGADHAPSSAATDASGQEALRRVGNWLAEDVGFYEDLPANYETRRAIRRIYLEATQNMSGPSHE